MAGKSWDLTWDEGMSVGIPDIDEDHKRFIALIDGFNKSVAERMEINEIQKRMQDILDDAVQHFALEQGLFDQWHYPEAERHARVHAQLLQVLQDIKSSISSGYDAEWVEAGFGIKDALITHFQTEDMKYAEFYRNSSAAPAAEETGS